VRDIHYVMTALFLVVFVLVLLELTGVLPSKFSFVEFPLECCRYVCVLLIHANRKRVVRVAESFFVSVN
jgi:hypothetical protein